VADAWPLLASLQEKVQGRGGEIPKLIDSMSPRLILTEVRPRAQSGEPRGNTPRGGRDAGCSWAHAGEAIQAMLRVLKDTEGWLGKCRKKSGTYRSQKKKKKKGSLGDQAQSKNPGVHARSNIVGDEGGLSKKKKGGPSEVHVRGDKSFRTHYKKGRPGMGLGGTWPLYVPTTGNKDWKGLKEKPHSIDFRKKHARKKEAEGENRAPPRKRAEKKASLRRCRDVLELSGAQKNMGRRCKGCLRQVPSQLFSI